MSLDKAQNEVIKLLLSEYEWAIPSKLKGVLERKHILETIRTADGFVKQGELIKAKASLEGIKGSEFLTEAEQELIAKGLEKLDKQLDKQKKEITEPSAPTEAQPEDTQPEETLPKNQVQEVNLKSEAPSF